MIQTNNVDPIEGGDELAFFDDNTQTVAF